MKTAFAAALLVLTVLSARRVRACECADDAFDRVVLPANGATDVATDAHVWTFGRLVAIQALSLDGERIAQTARFDSFGGALRRWSPVEPLAAATRHSVETDSICISGCAETDAIALTFDTGLEPAGGPLTAPVITRLDWHEEGGGLFDGSSSCGDSAFFRVTVQGDAGSVLLIDLAPLGGDDLADEGVDLVAPLGPDGRAEFVLGTAACIFTWDFDEHERAPFRIGTLDAAGRFTGWSEREVAEAPGCQGGSFAGGGSVGLIGLLLVRLVRRRTAHDEADTAISVRRPDRERGLR